MGDNKEVLEQFKASMCRDFEMTDMGIMQYYLGIEVTQKAEGIHLSQQKYIKEILNRFGMNECNSLVNPMVPGNKLKIREGEEVDETLYKQMVGSLMYLTATRPDIQFVVSLVSRFMSKPTSEHMMAVKRIIRYIKGTTDFGLFYKCDGSGGLKVYTDSDFVGDWNDRKSTSGYVIMWNESTVSWMSKKQDIVSLSSTEVEYVAAAKCASQVLWLKGVIFKIKIKEAIQIRCDNTSSIKMSKNLVFHGRCKHIGVRFHFMRQLVNEGEVELVYCESEKQVADIMTKPL